MIREQHPGSSGSELGNFLRARRTQLTPQEAGLTLGPGLRRTPGLRREELATLAGVSIDYYARLERGKETRPSPAVVDARALRLAEDEHEHLRDLAARAARHAPEPPTVPGRTVRPGIELLLETLQPNPAYVLSRTDDVLAHNPGGLALFAGSDSWPPGSATSHATCSSTPRPASSSRTGTSRSAAASPACAPWPSSRTARR
jgi:transcriptional regulator with XRE-family HTH domain